jgi:hypothetical protein
LRKGNGFILLVFMVFGWFTPVNAQADQTLTLRISRTFGYSSGTGKIQGRFTLKAAGPDNLVSVTFFMDGEQFGEVKQAPFHLSFVTDAYPLGLHSFVATGLTADGSEIRSNIIQAEFVSANESWQAATRVAAPIFGIVILVMILSTVATFWGRRKSKDLPLGAPRQYGYAGGAICPRCQRPYPRNVLSPNMLIGKLERCPFCGKWAIVPAVPIDILRAAEQAELQSVVGDSDHTQDDEQERLRRDLDDSRYQDL